MIAFIENDLAFSIWSYELQVMGKKKVGSQISKSPQGKGDKLPWGTKEYGNLTLSSSFCNSF